ncbi:lysophospholipid acyltransferase family protein [Occultella glacieicola]|uniref:lysophospholipid acyltransferase family protein n=1 Tax=Occultella glacieicola TaxID=2518684 RepID=UPI001F414FEC|nr:lysophospholipid acyltransferase family protein [Occultella glacieicola]
MSRPRPPRSYRAAVAIARPPVRLLTRPTHHGAEHLPGGGFIAAANHVTNFDPLTLLDFLTKAGCYPKMLAKASLFRVPLLGPLLRSVGYIPVQRGTGSAAASLTAAASALGAGECVSVFPEGTLTRDPDLWPMRAKTGAARMALATGMPVVPIAQWGAHEVMARHASMIRPVLRRPVQVVAGPPVDLGDLAGRGEDPGAVREATDRIMTAITAQLAGIRGERPPAEPFEWRPDPTAGYAQ